MKKLQHFLAITILLFLRANATNAQTADQIIQKHVEAIGGVANWKKVNSMIAKGSIHADNQEYSYYTRTLNGKGERKDFSAGGMTAFEIITKKNGWAYVPQPGLNTSPEVMPEIARKRFRREIDLQGPLIGYKAKGNKATYIGKGEFDSVMCYKLQIEFADKHSEIMYFDTSDYLHIGTTTLVTEHGKTDEERAANYWNFKKLPEGIIIPMNFNTGDGNVKLDTVEINKPVNEKIFDPKYNSDGAHD